MTTPRILPVMPSENVLFPGMLLPLHVRRASHLLLVTECLDSHGELGMILEIDDAPQQIGTVAKIIDYQPQEGGEMTLLVTGTERFTIAEMITDEPYTKALIAPYPFLETMSKDELDDRAEQVRRLFNNCVKLIASQRGCESQGVIALPEQTNDLGWTIASALSIPPLERQQLLEKESPASLLQSEIIYLESLLAELREQNSMES
ncbi:MAG TPA: LON peptidase substrate-binding domain-containing protein [Planctomycetota bacterium]|nr:LON peptidase substrate-binding domain-containing protein [Planctomycetota bacterium]